MATPLEGQIHIRPYEDRDGDQVRKLVLRGYMNGVNSPFEIGMRSMWWEPICAVAYPLSALALGILLKYGHGGLTIRGLLRGLLILAFPILWVRFWQWRYSKRWWDYCDSFMVTGDMADIGSFYAQEKGDGGVSAFWVAVAMEGGEERIAGCAGLDAGAQGSGWSELQRVSVSEDYRRRGVATLLINAACSHARAKGLRKVKLHSTTYQANAQVLYRRLGFVHVGRVKMPPVWVKGIWNHEMELVL
ncbi:acyl-CoA N-acyltransferase [Coprinellus micaceus]|uniref:Acyl-CoA N-acyltransferase n=1 Tax=Coprinellus micaceus TaxID=71717 RepID=A0A4Y7T2L5_COPMI|nr:acyl-CoA N-acyltransferase [Coprinellus micaceus]